MVIIIGLVKIINNDVAVRHIDLSPSVFSTLNITLYEYVDSISCRKIFYIHF